MTATPEEWGDEAADRAAIASGFAISYVVQQWISKPDIPVSDLTGALAQLLFEANDLGWQIGDHAIADLASQHAGTKIEPFGLHAPEEDEERLAQAVDLIFDGEAERLIKRMERIALAEPLRAAKRSKQAAMKARGVEQWVRVVQPKACESCADLLGQVAGIDVLFMDHPGCRCSLRAVIPQGWGDEVAARQLQLRSVSPSGVRFSSGITFNTEGGALK